MTVSVTHYINFNNFQMRFWRENIRDMAGDRINKSCLQKTKVRGTWNHLTGFHYLCCVSLYLQTFASEDGRTLVVIVTSQVPHALHGWLLSQTVLRWTLIWWLYITRRRMCLFNTVTTAISPGLVWMTAVSKALLRGQIKKLAVLGSGLQNNQTTGTTKIVCTLLERRIGTLGMTYHAMTASTLLALQVWNFSQRL